MPRTPREGGAQDPRGTRKRQPGRRGSQARTPTHKPPSHLCTLQPAPPPAECDPTGEGGGEAHLRIFAGGHPFPLGTAWRAGQTEELTMFIMIRREPHPGAAPSTAVSHTRPPAFRRVPELLILWGPQKGRERSCYAKAGACARNGGRVGAGVPRQARNLGVRQPMSQTLALLLHTVPSHFLYL